MSKYIVENDIDFYKHLHESDDATETNVCLISGMPLQEKRVKLVCGHKFNYEPLYNDIFNQRYKQYQTSNIYYSNPSTGIVCPYCRHQQYELLPHYPELKFKLIYGINTKNEYYKISKIVNNSSPNNIVYANTLSYFMGTCNYIDEITNEYCSKNYVILHGPTNKTYCNCHIFTMKKQYNLQQKLIAKQKIKEEKELIKSQLKAEKILQKALKLQEQEQNKCVYIFKRGKQKGEVCGCKSIQTQLCKKHIITDNTI